MRRFSVFSVIVPAFFCGCDSPPLPKSRVDSSNSPAKVAATGHLAQPEVRATDRGGGAIEPVVAPPPEIVQNDASKSVNPAPKKKSFETAFAEGQRSLDDGENQFAVAAFNEAIRADPKAARAYNARGVAFLRMQRLGSALKDFTRAIELMPNEAKFYANRSMVHSDQEDYAQAIADLSRAIDLDPEEAKWLEERAYVYRKSGDQVLAQSDLDAAQELGGGAPLESDNTSPAVAAKAKSEAKPTDPLKARRATGRRLADWVWLELSQDYDFKAAFANVVTIQDARVRFVNPERAQRTLYFEEEKAYSYTDGANEVKLIPVRRKAALDDSYAYQIEYVNGAGQVFRNDGYVEIGYDDAGTAYVLGVVTPFLNSPLNGLLLPQRSVQEEALGRAFGR